MYDINKIAFALLQQMMSNRDIIQFDDVADEVAIEKVVKLSFKVAEKYVKYCIKINNNEEIE